MPLQLSQADVHQALRAFPGGRHLQALKVLRPRSGLSNRRLPVANHLIAVTPCCSFDLGQPLKQHAVYDHSGLHRICEFHPGE